MPTTEIELEFNPSDANIAFTPEDGTLVANGKLGIITSLGSQIDVTRVVTSRDVVYSQGLYQPNVVDVFNPCRVSLYNVTGTDVSCSNVTNSLLMETGSYRSTYTVSNLAPDDGSVCDVSMKLYAMRHLPYTMLQTIEVTPQVLNSTATLDMFHEVYTKTNIRDATYDHTFAAHATSQQIMHQFYGSGTVADEGIAQTAFSTCYLVETGVGTTAFAALGSGRPLVPVRPNSAYYQMQWSGLQVGVSFKIHMITTLMTDQDFSDPKTETRAVSSSIASARGGNVTNTINWLLGKHVDAWSVLWRSRVRVVPKPDAAAGDLETVTKTNKLLNVALYNIYSSVRENYNVDLGTGSSMPVLDFDGSFLYDADLWFIPILLIVKPLMARAIVEYRFKTLQTAQQLAAAYGFRGAKFPYVDDVLGYRNNLYFQDASAMHLYNGALVATHAWNYYRATKDRDWLMNKGYLILKEVANFLADVAQQADGEYTYYFTDTIGLNGVASARDNAFTNNLAKLALRYAIEASYELRLNVPAAWNDVYEGLVILKYVDVSPSNVVIKPDSEATSNIGQDGYKVLETLFAQHPMFWEEELFVYSDRSIMSNSIKANLEFYALRIANGEEYRPTNIALQAVAAGVHGNTNTSYLAQFTSHTQSFIDNVVHGPWYFMRHEEPAWLPQNVRGGREILSKNSIYSNAMFLSIFLQGIAQMRWSGGVSDTRFYYGDLKLASVNTTSLPGAWSIVSFENMGIGTTLDTRQGADSGGAVDSGGSGGILPPDFSIYTP